MTSAKIISSRPRKTEFEALTDFFTQGVMANLKFKEPVRTVSGPPALPMSVQYSNKITALLRTGKDLRGTLNIIYSGNNLEQFSQMFDLSSFLKFAIRLLRKEFKTAAIGTLEGKYTDATIGTLICNLGNSKFREDFAIEHLGYKKTQPLGTAPAPIALNAQEPTPAPLTDFRIYLGSKTESHANPTLIHRDSRLHRRFQVL